MALESNGLESVGAWSRSYRKRFYIGTGKSKKIVPERPRRESSTTAFKAAAKTGGISYLHKGKGAMGRGIEDEGQKGSNRGSSAHTHDQRREAWKTTESCSMTKSGSSNYRYVDCHKLGFWVTVGKGPQFCNGDTFRPPI